MSCPAVADTDPEMTPLHFGGDQIRTIAREKKTENSN